MWDALGGQIAAFLESVTLQEVVDGIPPGKRACVPQPCATGSDRGMSAARTYLDWNATAPLRPEARAAMVAALDVVGNPSSPHAEGRRARAVVEDAREQVAALVGARPSEVVFTSGGTEANNAVLRAAGTTIFVAGIEHDSVLAPARASEARIIELAVDAMASCALTQLAESRPRAGTRALAAVAADCQQRDGRAAAGRRRSVALARAHGLAVHTDAVQAAGRVPVDMRALGVDILTLSAHKIGGPKGVGALVVREACSMPRLHAGGGQERRRRAGTENVAAIAGFGAAASRGMRAI